MATNYDQHFKKVKQAKKAKQTIGEGRNTKAEASSDQLRRLLNVKTVSRSTNGWSFIIIGLAAIGLGVGCVGYVYPSAVEQFLSRIQIGVFSSASAAPANPTSSSGNTSAATGTGTSSTSANSGPSATNASASTSANSTGGVQGPSANSAASGVSTNDSACPTSSGYTEEELNGFSKLNQREHQLDLRAAELDALEKELHKQQVEIEGRIAKLQKIRQDIASALKGRVQAEQKRVDTLVNVYSNMSAHKAAAILAGLKPQLAIEILAKMKKKNAAAIMNRLPASTAQNLSERFTGYTSN